MIYKYLEKFTLKIVFLVLGHIFPFSENVFRLFSKVYYTKYFFIYKKTKK